MNPQKRARLESVAYCNATKAGIMLTHFLPNVDAQAITDDAKAVVSAVVNAAAAEALDDLRHGEEPGADGLLGALLAPDRPTAPPKRKHTFHFSTRFLAGAEDAEDVDCRMAGYRVVLAVGVFCAEFLRAGGFEAAAGRPSLDRAGVVAALREYLPPAELTTALATVNAVARVRDKTAPRPTPGRAAAAVAKKVARADGDVGTLEAEMARAEAAVAAAEKTIAALGIERRANEDAMARLSEALAQAPQVPRGFGAAAPSCPWEVHCPLQPAATEPVPAVRDPDRIRMDQEFAFEQAGAGEISLEEALRRAGVVIERVPPA